jgi:HK97 family phage major capsid protein
MPYNNLVSRSDAQALIPEQVSSEIIQNLPRQSAALTLFRRVPMGTNQTRMPVLSALPIAYWVSGDTGLKQTTEQAWSNKFLNVEELAAIVAIPENVLDDTEMDLWAMIRPNLEEAIGRAVDEAVLFGVNKPATWPGDLVATAITAGNTYTRGTNAAAAGGIAEDLNQLFGTVEADGFDVNGLVADRRYRSRLRGARDSTGQPIANTGVSEVLGVPVSYVAPGQWPTGSGAAEVIAGDFTQGIMGVRKDITFKLLDQAVLQDTTGAIIFNLAQQDMVALRVTFRCAFQVANPLTREQAVEANRYPFGVLRAP